MITRRKLIPAAAAGAVALGGLSRISGVAAQDATPAVSASPVVASIDELPLRNAGRLTVHADQPLYPPWFIDNDPTNGQGFESALTYAIAERLGMQPDGVKTLLRRTRSVLRECIERQLKTD